MLFVQCIIAAFFSCFFKPGFHMVFVGRTVLGKTVKDRKRPNGNKTERSAKTHKDWVAEIETSSVPATLAKTKENTLSDPKRRSAIVKD